MQPIDVFNSFLQSWMGSREQLVKFAREQVIQVGVGASNQSVSLAHSQAQIDGKGVCSHLDVPAESVEAHAQIRVQTDEVKVDEEGETEEV